MKTLVTGGAGFIGSHVVNHLIKSGHKIWVLDDLSGGFIENIHPQATFINGSINDFQLIDSLFNQNKFEYVFHLAAYAAEGLSHFIKRYNYNNNLIGSINLINASVNNNVKCFVYTSSIAVYGAAQLPMAENMIPVPEDSYGVAKLAVEQELRISHEMFGLNYVVFRPHNVYGENQNLGDRYRNVIGIFMNQLMQGLPVTIYGDGEQTRAFSYIDDVAPHIANSINNPGAINNTFNIGADQHYTINQLADAVMKAMNIVGEKVYLDTRNEVMHAFSDHQRARSVFNINDFVGLDEGLARMAAWAKKAGVRSSKKFEAIEVLKNLPENWLSD